MIRKLPHHVKGTAVVVGGGIKGEVKRKANPSRPSFTTGGGGVTDASDLNKERSRDTNDSRYRKEERGGRAFQLTLTEKGEETTREARGRG